MDERTKLKIKLQADEIRNKVKGSILMGIPIDMNDPDMILVAAYYISRYDQMARERDVLENK